MHWYIWVIVSAAAAAMSLQSCPTLCDPIDGSPPGSPVPGILQARTLEWVAIFFSNAWHTIIQNMCSLHNLYRYSYNAYYILIGVGYYLYYCYSCSVSQSCLILCDPHGLQHARLPCPSPSSRICSNSCPWSGWWHPTISSSDVPFSSRLQSFPASGSFPTS